MQLKNYQQKALEQLDLWIDALKDAGLEMMNLLFARCCFHCVK